MLKKGLGSKIKFHENSNKVVLLLHCFRASPRILSELSDILYEQGYSIYNLRLPGHGLVDEDEMLKVRKNDWLVYTENILLDLIDSFEEVYLCGISLGATIVFNLLTKYHKQIKRAALISPLFKPRQFKANFAVFLQYFIKKMKPAGIDTYSTVHSELFDDFISYFPLQQGYYVLRLARQNVKKITTPIPPTVAFLARNDKDMYCKDQQEIMQKNSNIELHILENSLHQLTIDVEKDFVHGQIVEFFS